MLVAVPEGRAEAAAWQAKRDVPFVVVTRAQGTPHEAVGLAAQVLGSLQQSGSVLIDSAGIVRHAHAATMPVNSYDKKGIDEELRALPVRPSA